MRRLPESASRRNWFPSVCPAASKVPAWNPLQAKNGLEVPLSQLSVPVEEV